MKRAMQALVIAGDEMKGDVLSNRKKISIREGHRDFSPGPLMLGCPHLKWSAIREITSVQHKRLYQVTRQELADDGFTGYDDAIETLQQWYPTIDLDSQVTVIRWK